MRVDYAELSLPGNRQENQDRVQTVLREACALMIVVDGMGGHAEGAKASEITVATLVKRFKAAGQPVLDPQGFLTLALADAHEQVVRLGDGIALEQRPRATCAVCLIQDANAYWAHVGDSRVYQLRDGSVLQRSRDHSHVELLRSEGLIAEHEMKNHPMRNFVECCLGGDPPLPDMAVAQRKKLESGDVLLVCTDGLWAGADDTEIAELTDSGPRELEAALSTLAQRAVARNSPHSDNTSAAALRWYAG